MSSSALLVLFGHENTRQGQLSEIARLRCDRAIAFISGMPNAKILPTGGFGEHFNRTARMHAQYLTDYLLSKGTSSAQILPGTDSGNTFEDCLCARKVALDNGFREIIAVTSDYHAPRVRLLMECIFEGLKFSVHECQTPPDLFSKQTRKEATRLKTLRRELITPVLYQLHQEFPASLYEAAGNEHRHYDTVSLAIVGAILAVSGAPFFGQNGPHGSWAKAGLFWVPGLLDVFLLLAYARAADTAGVARRTMRAIEVGFGRRGFSANYDPARLFGFRKWTALRAAVYSISVLLILLLGLTGILVFKGWLEV